MHSQLRCYKSSMDSSFLASESQPFRSTASLLFQSTVIADQLDLIYHNESEISRSISDSTFITTRRKLACHSSVFCVPSCHWPLHLNAQPGALYNEPSSSGHLFSRLGALQQTITKTPFVDTKYNKNAFSKSIKRIEFDKFPTASFFHQQEHRPVQTHSDSTAVYR